MDAAERALFIKLLDTLYAEDAPSAEKKETKIYISEPNEYIEKLEKRAASLKEVSSFNVGDIVCWKDGLKNKRLPDYRQPCIVLSILIPPITDDDDKSYTEILTVELGFIAEADEFFSFKYDGNRFRLFNK